MSDPVRLATQRVDPVPDYGTGFAPYFIPLALWVGALMTYFIVRPLSGRALASTLPDADVALAGLWPGVAVTSVQAVVLVLVLELALGLRPVQPVALLAVRPGLGVRLHGDPAVPVGGVGHRRQVRRHRPAHAAAHLVGGHFPAADGAALLSAHQPLAADDLRGRRPAPGRSRAATCGPWPSTRLVLLGFAALGVCATILTAHRRRTWTMDRLKPIVTMQ